MVANFPSSFVCVSLLSPIEILMQETWSVLKDLEDPELAERLPDTILHSRADSAVRKYLGALSGGRHGQLRGGFQQSQRRTTTWPSISSFWQTAHSPDQLSRRPVIQSHGYILQQGCHLQQCHR